MGLGLPAAPRVVSASAGINRLGGGGGDVRQSDVDRGRGRPGLARGALLVLLRWTPTSLAILSFSRFEHHILPNPRTCIAQK